MKSLALLILLGACGDQAREAPAPAGSPSTTTPPAPPIDAAMDLCAIGTTALASLSTCNGKSVEVDMVKARQAYRTVVDTVRATGNTASDLTCAQLLYAIDGELANAGCLVPLAAPMRARMLDLVEQWYATRTPVTPTGNAAADAMIGKIVKIRDAACACTTIPCLDALGAQMGDLGAFASDAPEVARTLGAALLDDVGRCGARLRKPIRR
ncbi:MAG: hypothetical protein NT062_39750 [Proteobacteria bacterium]|nr:hypothetical protein [Pseudomonadota bacterium]